MVEWQPLKLQLAAEVVFDHFTGGHISDLTKVLAGPPGRDGQYGCKKRLRYRARFKPAPAFLRQFIQIASSVDVLGWRTGRSHPSRVGEIKELSHVHLGGVPVG